MAGVQFSDDGEEDLDLSALSDDEAAAHLSSTSEAELRYQAQGGVLGSGRRLACSTKILGDLVTDVPADSQVHRQVVRKRAEVADIALDPMVTLVLRRGTAA
jgi:uncharacterized 2Fe-2S/4Fe-4S cluster protein (DUF4445 family)